MSREFIWTFHWTWNFLDLLLAPKQRSGKRKSHINVCLTFQGNAPSICLYMFRTGWLIDQQIQQISTYVATKVKYHLLLFLVKLWESYAPWCQFVIIVPQGLMKTLHLVTVKWAHVEDTVKWESMCLFDLMPLQIINHTAVCSSTCRSGSADKKAACHAMRSTFSN